MNEQYWTRWVAGTARNWRDLSEIIAETGVEVIDEDHRKMTEYALAINRLSARGEAGGVDMALIEEEASVLTGLLRYTEGHFAREETMIEEKGLPKIGLQREQHARILRSLRDVVDDFRAGRVAVTSNLRGTILQWVVDHINGTDVQTFEIGNWRGFLSKADRWEEVAGLIKRTGIGEIDEEHRKMTEAALDLAVLLDRDTWIASPGEAIDLLERLEEIAASHFLHEERFMAENGMNALAHQKAAHGTFLDTVSKLFDRIARGDPSLPGEFRIVILEWWISHINELDSVDFAFQNWIQSALDRAATVDSLLWVIRKTGIDAVDEDHRKLVALTFDLARYIEAEESGTGNYSEFGLRFGDLQKLAADHFEREERIMQDTGRLAIFDSHKAEHLRILGMLEEQRREVEAGCLRLSAAFKIRILEWWINHTNGMDARTFL